MSKTSLGKYKRPSKNSKLYKKSKKRIHTRSNFVVIFASKSRCINPHATWGTTGDICTSSVTCCTTCKEESGVAGSTFDEGWGVGWWQDVDGGAENEGWAVGAGEDGKVRVYGDVTVDRGGSGMLDGGWNFIWDDCGVPVEEDAEVGKVMKLSPGRPLMYGRKTVGPRQDPWGTQALTWYFCEDFPSRTTRSRLLLKKEEITPNIWSEIP